MNTVKYRIDFHFSGGARDPFLPVQQLVIDPKLNVVVVIIKRPDFIDYCLSVLPSMLCY